MSDVGTFLTPRERAHAAAVAVIPALIGMPWLISIWMPTYAVVTWMILYALTSVVGIGGALVGASRHEAIWSSSVGVLFGALPISAVIWGSDLASFWIATGLVLLFVCSEIAVLPFVRIGEWRVGVAASFAMLIGAGFFVLPLIPALVLIPVAINILITANGMRTMKDSLEVERSIARAETKRAQDLALHDELTGLLNRRGVTAQLQSLEGQSSTVVMFDVKNFKSVNDTFGYAAGDQVLTQVAAALRTRFADDWVLGRQGGDEFLAILPGRSAISEEISQDVLCDLRLYGAENRLSVALSAGVMFNEGKTSSDRIVSQVAYAMQASKRAGTRLSRFDGDLEIRFDRMLEVSAGAQNSLNSAAFDAAAQAVVDVDGDIVGFELLARWRRPDGTVVPPLEFLPLLAENGLMPMLNESMLEKGVEFAARFNSRPVAPFIAVNIGASNLASEGLVAFIGELLDRYRVEPTRLMIEITESEVLGDPTIWEASARQLEMLGVKLAIDDFGSGYSSIERMNQLPISHLKFDRSLNTAITGPLGEIIRGVARFAAQTGIGIIAEGIETIDEFQSMKAIGIKNFQGYWFSRPCSLDDAEKLLISQTSLSPAEPDAATAR